MHLSTAGDELPMRLESKGAAANQEAGGAVGKRNWRQPARALGETARGGESLGFNMAASNSAQSLKLSSVKRARAERPARGERGTRRRRFLLLASLTLGLIGAVLVHVWLRLQVVHMGYVLSTTSKLQGRLEQENRELKLELATMTSPDRLEALARKRLGLVPPEKGQVIVLP
jgi:cell division protein FtsL